MGRRVRRNQSLKPCSGGRVVKIKYPSVRERSGDFLRSIGTAVQHDYDLMRDSQPLQALQAARNKPFLISRTEDEGDAGLESLPDFPYRLIRGNSIGRLRFGGFN